MIATPAPRYAQDQSKLAFSQRGVDWKGLRRRSTSTLDLKSRIECFRCPSRRPQPTTHCLITQPSSDPRNTQSITSLFSCTSARQFFGTADGWQPSPGHVQGSDLPGAVPDADTRPEPGVCRSREGREWWPRANDVSRPTMTVYAAKGRNTGAVVVFPGEVTGSL